MFELVIPHLERILQNDLIEAKTTKTVLSMTSPVDSYDDTLKDNYDITNLYEEVLALTGEIRDVVRVYYHNVMQSYAI